MFEENSRKSTVTFCRRLKQTSGSQDRDITLSDGHFWMTQFLDTLLGVYGPVYTVVNIVSS